MTRPSCREVFLALSLLALGCGGSSSGDDGGSGSGGATTGGAGSGGGTGSGTGGATGAGGAGTGGAVTGGGGATGSGGAQASPPFWPAAYDPTCVPAVASGNHNAGKDCMGCHVTGGSASSFPWNFAGTVYQANGTTAAQHVEVGVKWGNQFLSVCSGTNGNFFLLSSLTIDWASAEVRARNAAGEVTMPGHPTTGACNSCHVAGSRIIQP